GGGIWDRQKAWQFLTDTVAMDRSFLAFELDSYLGWHGQAPTYKIGQRLWEQFRDEARASAGAAVDLKPFHTRALHLASVGLATRRPCGSPRCCATRSSMATGSRERSSSSAISRPSSVSPACPSGRR